jgi:TonB-linked SusC/RagA family outer membrane protein
MKKIVEQACSFYYEHRKKILIMRNAVLIILISAFQVFATSSYSQTAQLSLNLKDATIKEVLNEIENKSEFYFLYNSELIDVTRKVDIVVKNKKINDILSQLFSDNEVNVSIRDRHIILTPVTEMSTQQQKTVSGKVSDASGSALPGVSVVRKGTTVGTITDVNGNYSLSNTPENAVLQFSFVGMKTKEVSVAGKTIIDVTMEDDAIGIEEVVAIGYGVQKKINLTGSISTAQGEDLVKRPITNAASMLQGVMPGVQVLNSRGEPGNEGTSIRIRGTGTFSSAGSDPLILIDGVPGKLDRINPNDIESVSVLKDAASASIYGTRAANGVILVTTKTGVKGKLNIEYNGNFAIYKWTKMADLVTNSAEYMKLWNEAKKNTGLNTGLYTQEMIDTYANATDRVKYPNTDWVDLMIAPAPTQTHNLSVNGGSENIKYNFSLGYVDQKGFTKGFDYKRYNLRFNLTSKLNKIVDFGGSVGFSHDYRQGSRQGSRDHFVSILAQAPTYGPYLPDGSGRYAFKAYDFEYNNKNPMVIYKEEAFAWNRNYSFSPQMWAEVKPFKGFSWYTKGAVNIDIDDTRDFRPQVPLYNFHTYNYMTLTDVGGAGMTVGNNLNSYLNLYSYFAYEHLFAKVHSFKVQTGYSVEKNTYRSLSGYRMYYPSDQLRELNAGTTAVQQASGTTNEWAIMSYFGRINYDYKSRYLLEANIRHDGTSRLYADTRWGNFPSFSAAWRATEEQFIKNLNLSWLNDLKVRGSYGKLGNQNIGNYPYQAILNFTGDYPYDNAAVSPGVAQTELNNLNIMWEKTTVTDFGFDLISFNGLSLTADWYNKRTSDILRRSQVTSIVGLSAPMVNGGVMQNRGYEVSLTYNRNVKKGFFEGMNYYAGLSFDHFDNKLVSFGSEEKSGSSIRKEGLEWDSFYMLEWIGIFQTPEEVSSSPKQYSDKTMPGDLKWKDQITEDTDGDGIADAADGIVNDKDRVPLKGKYPSLQYSFNGGFNWDGFDFSFSFQGVEGIKYLWSTWGTVPFNQGVLLSYWKDHWTEENRSQTIPNIYWGPGAQQKITRTSSYFLQEGSYLRLRNLSFGYTLPNRISERIGCNSLRFFFSGDNLLTFTKYPGLDPERDASDTRYIQYPQNKIFSVGINAKF